MLILLGSSLCAFAAPDPFHTTQLTTAAPQSYWHNPTEFTVNTQFAQNNTAQLPKRPLSLAEITDFALNHNPNTRQLWNQAKLAAANLGVAKSAYLPQLTGGVSDQYGANVFTSNVNSNNTLGPNVSLSYVLLDFGNRANQVQAARYSVIAANLNQDTGIQQLILQIQQSYYQALGQQALVDANQKNLAEAKTSLAAAQALRKQGMATIGDVYQAQASLAQAQLNLEQALGNDQIAKGQLATSMGLPANTPLSLKPLADTPSLAAIKHHVSHLLMTAIQQRPDLLAAEAQVRADNAQLAATQAESRPVLQISADANPQTSDSGTVTATSVNVSITMPLFTGFSHSYAVKAAQAQAYSAQANRDQLLEQVQLQVWQAYYTVQTAQTSITTTQALYKSSLQANQQAMGQYKAGVGDILTVLSTQSALANARVQTIQAKLNWYVALAQLAAAMGTLV